MLMLVLSVLLGLIPLAGIAMIAVSGWIATVDGLFTSLILLAMSGVFFLNALLEVRAMGVLPFLKRAEPKPAATAAAASTPRTSSGKPSAVPASPPPPASNGVVTETGVVEAVSLYEMPVGNADKSLVSFRAEGSAAARSMVFSGNVQHLRPGHKVRISYKPSPDGNQLVTCE